jgi:hypothetical protein
MVQAQREAGEGKDISVEHIFLTLLSLYEKGAKEIARKPEQMEEVNTELANIRLEIEMEEIDVWSTYDKLRDSLTKMNNNLPSPDTDVPGLFTRAEKRGEVVGLTKIDGCNIFKEAKTPLVLNCIVECGPSMKPRKGTDDATGKPPSAADTIADISAVTVAQQENILPPPQSPPPQPPPPQLAPPRPVEIQKPQPEVQFFVTPVANDKQDIFKAKPGTKIAGFEFKLGLAGAVFWYFVVVICIPVAIILIAFLFKEQLPITNEWFDTILLLSIYYGIYMVIRGIISLIGRRFKPFEVYVRTVITILLVAETANLFSLAHGYEVMPMWSRIVVVVVGFVLLIHAIVLLQSDGKGKSGQSMNTTMLKLSGTPGSIFYSFALRSFLIPGIAMSIVWIWDLELNAFWHAAMAIYCFLWVYDVFRVMIRAWGMICKYDYHPGSKLQQFVQYQYNSLLLPALGYFLMWYFEWLPMPVWVIVLYSIYGLFWLIGTIAIIGKINKH